MIARRNIFVALFVLAVLTAGGTIFFFHQVAAGSDWKYAKEYPAMTANDSFQYALLAKNMVQNHAFSLSTSSPFHPDTFRTPGYPLFVAFFYTLFGSLYAVLIAQIFVVFLMSVLVFTIARRVMPERFAFVAAALYLLNPDTMLWAALTMTDTLFALLFTLVLYLLFFAEISSVYKRFLLCGLMLAVATYVRPVAIYTPIFLLPLYAWMHCSEIKERKKEYLLAGVSFLVIFFALLSPWYVRNYQVSGAIGFASIGPYDLFNHDVPYFLNSVYGTDVEEARLVLKKQVGMPTNVPISTDLSYAKAMEHTALNIMFSHFFLYTKYHLSSLPSFFFSPASHEYWRVHTDLLPNRPVPWEPPLAQALNPFSLPLLIVVFENHGWFLLENVIWLVILILILYGLWRGIQRPLLILTLVLAFYFALTTGPLSHARYRMPVDALLIISALAVVAETAPRFLGSRKAS